MRKIFLSAVVLLVLRLCAAPVFAQEKPSKSCLDEDDIKKMTARLQSSEKVILNDPLRLELLALKENSVSQFQENLHKSLEKDAPVRTLFIDRAQNEDHLCKLLKENGWPSVSLVGPEGSSANLFVLKNSGSTGLQLALLPVIGEAVKRNELEKNEAYASFIDRLRLNGGLKQLFGTQVISSGGFLVMEPIEDEANVNRRRILYGMGPLNSYMKLLESTYRLPLIRSPDLHEAVKNNEQKESISKTVPKDILTGGTGVEDEVISIDTNLVNLDVNVYASNANSPIGNFEQNDFRLFEDGKEEKITFFAKTDVPFDLVLLLDISGSTAKKTELIRKSAARFIRAARPNDRLAIVTFADEINVVSPLTSDREELLDGAKNIKGNGFSRVWDGLQFTLQNVLGEKTQERRRAVVFMTDGLESSVMYFSNFGSKTSFAELLDTVRKSESLIIPINIDTEDSESSSLNIHRVGRATLMKLAEESGGFYYRAKKLEDLNGVYEKVLSDLGKVYSLGYAPSNEKRDGKWRAVKVQIPARPDLSVRAKPGYYAN